MTARTVFHWASATSLEYERHSQTPDWRQKLGNQQTMHDSMAIGSRGRCEWDGNWESACLPQGDIDERGQSPMLASH